MDLLKIVIETIKKNVALFLILIIIAPVAGVTHYYLQSFSYISNFKTNNGFVDYPLFKSLTDFKAISGEVYDLPHDKIEEIKSTLEDFKVSFTEETTSSISFKIVTEVENADHSVVQNHILTLINNNKFVQQSQANDLKLMQKKLDFLKNRIAQLDSLMVDPSENMYLSKIPRDAYFLYNEQVDLEDKINMTGKFELIKPVIQIDTNKKPLILFVALYLVMAGFIFLVFSKKIKSEYAE